MPIENKINQSIVVFLMNELISIEIKPKLNEKINSNNNINTVNYKDYKNFVIATEGSGHIRLQNRKEKDYEENEFIV